MCLIDLKLLLIIPFDKAIHGIVKGVYFPTWSHGGALVVKCHLCLFPYVHCWFPDVNKIFIHTYMDIYFFIFTIYILYITVLGWRLRKFEVHVW